MSDNKGKAELDSSEKAIKSHSSDSKIFDKEKIIKKQKRRILILLITLLVLITLIIVGGFIYFFAIKKSDNKPETQEKNSIIAKYKINSGEEIQLFNDNNLDKENYEIELIDQNNRLRNLRSIRARATFDFTGEITININFFINVNSLARLFENVPQLKEVNFTDFNMSEVTNMDSAFSGCTSLENVFFDGVDSRNLQTMNFLFKNCTNLKNVNLSPLNILNVATMNSPFQGCHNLQVNISSFPKISDDFLLGTFSNLKFIANEKIYDKLNILLLSHININLNITIYVEQYLDNSCEKGEKEKCKTCCNNIRGNCFLCNDGYYLPIDSSNKKVCTSCSVKKHCKKCIGLTSYILCQECEEGYILENNICKAKNDRKEEEEEKEKEDNNELELEKEYENKEKEKKEIKENNESEKEKGNEKEENNKSEKEYENKEEEKKENNKSEKEEDKKENNKSEKEEDREEFYESENEYKEEKEKEKEKQEEICILGEGEKCKSCKKEKGMNNQCSECNEGYYLPIDKSQNLKCESCSKLENCLSCNGTSNSPTCNKCETGFKLISNKCKKKSCIIGSNEKCMSCKNGTEECLSCNEGYFLPDDSSDKTKCTKCQLDGCKTCSGNITNNQCSECFKNPKIKDGKIILCNFEEKTEHCSYFDKNNKCLSCDRSYKLVDGECLLINNTFYAVYNVVSTENPTKIMCNYHIDLKLSEIEMYDNGEIVYPSIIDVNRGSSLPYIVYTFKTLGLHNITVSIHRNLYSCIGWMFGMCENLVSVKFDKDFDTRYVTSIYNMFCHDYMLTSVDMSNFNTSSMNDMVDVFWYCESITSLDLSNFDTSKVTRMEGIFDNCKNLSYIDISSFNMTKVKDTKSMFYNTAKNGEIRIGKYFGDYKKLIPKNWKIIE